MTGGPGSGLWYRCDALAVERNCVANLSADRKAVRIAKGYLGCITKDTEARDGPGWGSARGWFAAKRGQVGAGAGNPGQLY